MQKHYVCLGGCKGVSKVPGVCEASNCVNHNHNLVECNCVDGLHNGFRPKVQEVSTGFSKKAKFFLNIFFYLPSIFFTYAMWDFLNTAFWWNNFETGDSLSDIVRSMLENDPIIIMAVIILLFVSALIFLPGLAYSWVTKSLQRKKWISFCFAAVFTLALFFGSFQVFTWSQAASFPMKFSKEPPNCRPGYDYTTTEYYKLTIYGKCKKESKVLSEENVGDKEIKVVGIIDKEAGSKGCHTDGACTYVLGDYQITYTVGWNATLGSIDHSIKTGDKVEVYGSVSGKYISIMGSKTYYIKKY